MKTVTYIGAAYLLVAVTYLLFFKPNINQSNTVIKKDSTVVYITDSNVYHPKVDQSTIKNTTNQFFYYGSDSTACDSIREYTPTAKNDSILQTVKLLIHGKLLNANLSYKFLRPIETIKTITITNTIEKYKGGIFVGAGVGYKKYLLSQCPVTQNLSFQGQIGYATKGGWMIEYGYNSNNIHSLSTSIFLRNFKK